MWFFSGGCGNVADFSTCAEADKKKKKISHFTAHNF